jgi:CMP-N,N'-diacetyllegionaminic acid synthase
MSSMNVLFIITARGGSKGIPGKNWKKLAGKPLILYSLEYARLFASDTDICVSSDSKEILDVVEKAGYKVPFIRPERLSRDNSGSYEVIIHAIEFYRNKGVNYDVVVLLQPTSPMRLKEHYEEALSLFSSDIDMVVSVFETRLYHYYQEIEGFLKLIGETYHHRQDAPKVYKHNGSIYIINTASLLKYSSFSQFSRVRKYIMPENYSLDIDTLDEWNRLEYLLSLSL